MHTPGLKVVAPATPADAKGLLLGAIRDNNPVVYFESKPLYRSLRGEVPDGDAAVPIGKARVARAGRNVTVITYGEMLRQALEAAEGVDPEISVEVIDLRTLKPLDRETILSSARKTGRVVVVHAANRMAGIGAEIAADIGEVAFEYLDRPGHPAGRPRHPGTVQPPAGGRLPPSRSRYSRGDTRDGRILNRERSG